MLIFHAGEDDIEFNLPPVERGEDLSHWTALLSTDSPNGEVDLKAPARSRITVPARTVMIFIPSTELNGSATA